MALMKKAAEKAQQAKSGKGFTRPKINVPPEMQDAVDRIVAAGMKLIYSPSMKDERDAALQSDDPIAKVLATNVVGLTLVLDQQSQGGIPEQALLPAALELLLDVADMMVKAGKTVTQDDINDAALMMHVMIAKKLGVSDEEVMNGARQGAQQAGGDAEGAADTQDPDEAQEPAAGEPPMPTAQGAPAMPPQPGAAPPMPAQPGVPPEQEPMP